MPNVLILERFISINSGFEMTDDNRFLSFIFHMGTTINLMVGRKKKRAEDIFKGILNIEFEQD